MKTKKIVDQLNRIKSLFTEERLYGNLVEQKEPESTTEKEPKSPTVDITKKEPVKYGGGSLAGKSFSTDEYSVKKINTPLQSGFEYYVDTKSKDVYKVKNNKIDTVYKFNESFNINLLYKNVLNEDWSKINEAYYTIGNSDKKMSDKFFNIAQKALTSTETEKSNTTSKTEKPNTEELKNDDWKKIENDIWKKYPCVTNNKNLKKEEDFIKDGKNGIIYSSFLNGKYQRIYVSDGTYVNYDVNGNYIKNDSDLHFTCKNGEIILDTNEDWKKYPCIINNNKYKKQTNSKGKDYYYKVGNPDILYYSNGTYYDGTSDVPKYVDYNCDDIK